MSDPNNKLIDPDPDSAAHSDDEQMPPPTPAAPAPGCAGLEPCMATVTQGAPTTSSSSKTGSPLPNPSGSTSDTVVETMLSMTTGNNGVLRPKKKKAKLMHPGVTTTARYVYYNICRLVNNHIESRNLFAIDHLKDHAITSQEFALAWLNLEPSKREVSCPPSMSASSNTYPTTGIHTMGGRVEETQGVKTPDF
jgi:hypothetical protein